MVSDKGAPEANIVGGLDDILGGTVVDIIVADKVVVNGLVAPLLEVHLRAAYSLPVAVVRRDGQRRAGEDRGGENRGEVHGC